MFKTQEQIDEVSVRTGVSSELIRKLGMMMSKVKIAQEDLKIFEDPKAVFLDELNTNARKMLNEALTYFENDFLQCKLW